MSMKINDTCIACGVCYESGCPVDAIAEGDELYSIDAAKCVECEGYFDEPQCASVCPEECISKT